MKALLLTGLPCLVYPNDWAAFLTKVFAELIFWLPRWVKIIQFEANFMVNVTSIRRGSSIFQT